MMGLIACQLLRSRACRRPIISRKLQSCTHSHLYPSAAAVAAEGGPYKSRKANPGSFGITLLQAMAGAACVHFLGYSNRWSAAAEDLFANSGDGSTVPPELLVALKTAVGSERVVVDEGVTDAHIQMYSSGWTRYQKPRKPDAVVFPRYAGADLILSEVRSCSEKKVMIVGRHIFNFNV